MNFGNIATSPELLALLEKARAHVMTPAEVFEQRVSFVFGMLSSKSKLTRDDVRQFLIKQNGIPPEEGGAS